MKMKKKKGFTLTELIVVMAVIAILAAVLIPSITGYVKKAKQSNQDQEAKAVYDVLDAWFVDMEANDTYLKLDVKTTTSEPDGKVSDAEILEGFKIYYKEITGSDLGDKVLITFSKDTVTDTVTIDMDGENGLKPSSYKMGNSMKTLYNGYKA